MLDDELPLATPQMSPLPHAEPGVVYRHAPTAQSILDLEPTIHGRFDSDPHFGALRGIWRAVPGPRQARGVIAELGASLLRGGLVASLRLEGAPIGDASGAADINDLAQTAIIPEVAASWVTPTQTPLNAPAVPWALIAPPGSVHAARTMLHVARPGRPARFVIGYQGAWPDAEASASALCLDPLNRLADITVGPPGWDRGQWVLARNWKGAILAEALWKGFTRMPLRDLGQRHRLLQHALDSMAFHPDAFAARTAPLTVSRRRRWGVRELDLLKARIERMALLSALDEGSQGPPGAIQQSLIDPGRQLVSAYRYADGH